MATRQLIWKLAVLCPWVEALRSQIGICCATLRVATLLSLFEFRWKDCRLKKMEDRKCWRKGPSICCGRNQFPSTSESDHFYFSRGKLRNVHSTESSSSFNQLLPFDSGMIKSQKWWLGLVKRLQQHKRFILCRLRMRDFDWQLHSDSNRIIKLQSSLLVLNWVRKALHFDPSSRGWKLKVHSRRSYFLFSTDFLQRPQEKYIHLFRKSNDDDLLEWP